jgi:GT2 family glycosyltransferase
VVVVDNSGTFPSGALHVLDPGRNVGFGAGCNLGVSALPSHVKAVCLHNPDASATSAQLLQLAVRLGEQRRPGLLAPAGRTGGEVRPAGYRYPSPVRELALGWRATHGGGRADVRADAQAPRTTTAVGGRRFGTAAMLLADRGALAAVSGFDERYFLYVEDLDLWDRVAAAGYDVGFAPEVVVGHEGAAGSDAGAGLRALLRWLGVEQFSQLRAHGRWSWLRAAHRPFLARLDAPAHVVGEVRKAWQEGVSPVEVQERVRPHLERRRTPSSAS